MVWLFSHVVFGTGHQCGGLANQSFFFPEAWARAPSLRELDRTFSNSVPLCIYFFCFLCVLRRRVVAQVSHSPSQSRLGPVSQRTNRALQLVPVSRNELRRGV
jgi:hypothetical protein